MLDFNAEYEILSFSVGDTKAGTKMGKMQIKNVETLDLDNPPIFFPLKFKNLKTNAEGLYLYDEFEEHLNKAISEYDLFF